MANKVLVAMSGGVDSCAAASVILESGYEASGAIMKLYGDNEKDIADAGDAAKKLGMPFYVYDFSEKFKEKVIDDFTLQYKNALTPNPCIVCNKYIKFGAFLEKATEQGFDKVATGHYAKVEFDEVRKRYVVRKADDEMKDQSYVLYTLSQEQLSKIILPLGSFTKAQAREKAMNSGFKSAERKESQDICFVPDGDYASFIEKITGITFPAGDFIEKNGSFIAKHKGLINYTVGQRKGLGIAAPAPYYVLSKNAENNTVTLGSNDDLFSTHLEASYVNFISIEKLECSMRVKAKIRYKHKEIDAVISPLKNGNVSVDFDVPQRAATPGQSVVFYDGDVVVGGGIIV